MALGGFDHAATIVAGARTGRGLGERQTQLVLSSASEDRRDSASATA